MAQRQTTVQFCKNQAGMASILITMVTLIVVSLIVIGFATISQREQGQTLDQQLSTQAFYAAESAVNDARAVINAAVAAGQQIPAKTQCNTDDVPSTYPVPTAPATSVVIDASHPNISYTCLLVDPTPSTVTHDNIGDNAWVIPITSATQDIAKITVQWGPPTLPATIPSSDCRASLTFSPSSGWACGYGLLRMDLVPTDASDLNAAALSSKEITAFFEPQSVTGSGVVDYPGNSGNANLRSASCSVTSYANFGCSGTIDQLPPGKRSFTLRINSLYQLSNVQITAYDASGGKVSMTGGPVIVDATGNAGGVLRRIQVTVPVNDFTDNTNFAIQSSGSVCKRFSVTPSAAGYFSIASDLATPDPDSANAMCQSVDAGTP